MCPRDRKQAIECHWYRILVGCMFSFFLLIGLILPEITHYLVKITAELAEMLGIVLDELE